MGTAIHAKYLIKWSERRDLNPRPPVPQHCDLFLSHYNCWIWGRKNRGKMGPLGTNFPERVPERGSAIVGAIGPQ